MTYSVPVNVGDADVLARAESAGDLADWVVEVAPISAFTSSARYEQIGRESACIRMNNQVIVVSVTTSI